MFKNVFKPLAIIPLAISSFIAVNVSHLLLLTFVVFYLLDFVTGTFATRVEIKKDPEKYKALKERKGKAYWIESERIVRGIVKAIIYLQLIILAAVATKLLGQKYFQLHPTLIPLSLFQLLLILCITAEFVSNLENAKRAGFDVVGLLANWIKKIWSLTRLIKTGKEE